MWDDSSRLKKLKNYGARNNLLHINHIKTYREKVKVAIT